MLRYAPRLAPVPEGAARKIAISLGADVPSQLEPGLSLGTGAGEVLEAASVPDHSLVLVPQAFALSTPEVYREADRLGLVRSAEELATLRDGVLAGSAPFVNDLQEAALSLRPEIGGVLDLVGRAGADVAMVSGSGPTVIGVVWGADRLDDASRAADELRDRYPRALAATPIHKGTRAGAPND
ncbi:MAG: hypothetical protein WAK93_11285, partial [Solirubrobacteraceae bacterium]